MYIVHIEHSVSDYNAWKKLFDEDPLGRQKMGVRTYRILRPVDDPRAVIVDLVFDQKQHAETMQTALKDFWKRLDSSILINPKARVLEIAEMKEVTKETIPMMD